MADPISIGLILGGTLISAVGSISQGNAAARASRFNAFQNLRNAVLVREQAARDAAALNRRNRRQLGLIRANFGASGVQLEGSPLDVLASSAAEAKLDELTIIHKGELRALGFQESAFLDREAAENAETQGIFNAASDIFTGSGAAFRANSIAQGQLDIQGLIQEQNA